MIKEYVRRNSVYVALGLIIVIGFLLRYPVIHYTHYFGDEHIGVDSGRSMLMSGDFRPKELYYGYLHSYILFAADLFYFLYVVYSGPEQFILPSHLDPFIYYKVGRFVSVLFGTLSVLVIFILGKKIFNQKVGLISAMLLAFFPFHIEHSYVAKPDVIMVFFSLIALIFIYMMMKNGRFRYYLYASIFIAVAAATKYQGVSVIIAFVVAFLISNYKEKNKAWDRPPLEKMLISFLIMIAVFLFICPIFRDYVLFRNHIRVIHAGEEFHGWYNLVFRVFRNSLGYLFFLSLAGIVYSLYRRTNEDFLLSLYVMILILVGHRVIEYYPRYVLVQTCCLIILSSRLIVDFAETDFSFFVKVMNRFSESDFFSRFKNLRRYRYWIVAIFLLTVNLKIFLQIIEKNKYLTTKETRTLALEWIKENVPQNAKILIGGNAGIMSADMVDFRKGLDYYKQRYDFFLFSVAYGGPFPGADTFMNELRNDRNIKPVKIILPEKRPGPEIDIYQLRDMKVEKVMGRLFDVSKPNLVRNGSFEANVAYNPDGPLVNNWVSWPCVVSVSLDTTTAVDGKQSVKLYFKDRRDYVYQEFRQVVKVKPKTSYFFSCFAKANLSFEEQETGVHILILHGQHNEYCGVFEGDLPWTYVQREFTTEDEETILIQLTRFGGNNHKIQGNFWLDYVILNEY